MIIIKQNKLTKPKLSKLAQVIRVHKPLKFTPFILILLTGFFYLATIRTGQNWGDDFAMYIHHAQNFVQGRSYSDTGYIYNPFAPGVGPRSYPPIYPLMLAPIYAVWGFDFTPMKIEIILFFIGSLILLVLYYRKFFTLSYLSSYILLIGFNANYWDFKDNIQSDIPFLFFLCLTIFLLNKAQSSYYVNVLLAIFSGIAMYLAYGTRTIGFLLPLSLLLTDFIQYRRLRKTNIISLGIFIICFGVQSILIKSDASYFDTLSFDPSHIIYNIYIYMIDTANFWQDGYTFLNFILFFLINILAGVGYITLVKSKVTFLEIFIPLYTILILLWPAFQTNRFFLPIFPFYLQYVFFGIRTTVIWLKKQNYLVIFHNEKTMFYSLLLTLILFYGLRYTTLEYGPITNGMDNSATIALFDYIKDNTSKNAITVFVKARALSLYTQRASSVFYKPDNYSDLWSYFQSIKVNYFVVNSVQIDGKNDLEYLLPFLDKYKSQLFPVYSNVDFKVYKVIL